MSAPKYVRRGYIGHVDSYERLQTLIAKPEYFRDWPCPHTGLCRGIEFHILETKNAYVVQIGKFKQRFMSMLACWDFIMRMATPAADT